MNKTPPAIANEQSSSHPLLPWAAAAGGGLLAFLGYVGFDQFYLEWICLVPILWAMSSQTPRRAFLLGWTAGIVGHGCGFSWVVIMLRQFADAPWPLAIAGLLLLAAANGLVFAVWAGVTRLITRDADWSVAWVSPAVWVAAEKFWPQVFPNSLGASQYRLVPVTQIADVAGILGVTFLLVYGNSAIYETFTRYRAGQRQAWQPAAVFAAVLVVAIAYGGIRMGQVDRAVSSAKTLSVGLVQANLGAREKHLEMQQLLREHQEMSRELAASRKPDLIVWPESVLEVGLARREDMALPIVQDELHTPLLFGALVHLQEKGKERLYNSAILLDGDGRIKGIYDKMVLVPFGEYIPFGDVFPGLYSWSPYSSRFWRGTNREPLLLGGHAVSVSICYEDIFAGQIRMLMQGGREHRVPEAMFNLTNDSWYGDTIEPKEHLVLASFRAIEHRRPLVRSTNTGISAIVDPVGRIVRRTGQWTKETLTGTIPLMEGGTFYAAAGDWIGWVCGMITLLGIAAAQRARGADHRRRKKGRGGRAGW